MAQSQVKTKQSAGGIEALPELKGIAEVRAAPGGHWVGDGFPVRTVFGYDNAEAVSPFLLLDYAGPFHFPRPTSAAASANIPIAASRPSRSCIAARWSTAIPAAAAAKSAPARCSG